MGERGDIIRLMQRELTARRLDRAGVEQVVATVLREPFLGRLIRHGFSDEHRDRHCMIIDGADGRVHYVDIGRGDATPTVPEGATIRIEPSKVKVTAADRTIDMIARANGGRCSLDLHLRHDPQASEAYATSHVRRLEAMRRGRTGPERLADGTWSIPDDHLARAEALAQRQQRDRPVSQGAPAGPPTRLARKGPPHAVEALELVLPGRKVRSDKMADRRQRLRIVRGELREDRVRRRRQFARAGDKGDVGMVLSRIDGKIGKPVDLRPFDFRVPIGAFDEVHHDPPIGAARKIDNPIYHEGAALAVGLDHEAQPSRQARRSRAPAPPAPERAEAVRS